VTAMQLLACTVTQEKFIYMRTTHGTSGLGLVQGEDRDPGLPVLEDVLSRLPPQPVQELVYRLLCCVLTKTHTRDACQEKKRPATGGGGGGGENAGLINFYKNSLTSSNICKKSRI
jgi:hypothetical protein